MFFSFQDLTYFLGIENVRKITVSGAVAEGEVLVVRGPSGAGKSTLLRILSRLQPCSHGEVFFKGDSWLQIPATTWRARIHYFAQKPVIFDGTVADNLNKPFETNIGSKKVFDPDLAKTMMSELLLEKSLWEQDAKTLSGGEAIRIAFIRSLLIEPQVLLLDEPTAALDEGARKAFYKVFKRWLSFPEHAALLVSHYNDYHQLKRVSFLDIISVSKG